MCMSFKIMIMNQNKCTQPHIIQFSESDQLIPNTNCWTCFFFIFKQPYLSHITLFVKNNNICKNHSIFTNKVVYIICYRIIAIFGANFFPYRRLRPLLVLNVQFTFFMKQIPTHNPRNISKKKLTYFYCFRKMNNN